MGRETSFEEERGGLDACAWGCQRLFVTGTKGRRDYEARVTLSLSWEREREVGGCEDGNLISDSAAGVNGLAMLHGGKMVE